MSSFSLSTLLNPQVSRFSCRYGSFLPSSCRGNFVFRKLAQRKNESKIDERVKGVKIHVRGRLCGSRTFVLVLFCSFFFLFFVFVLFLFLFFYFFLFFFYFFYKEIFRKGVGAMDFVVAAKCLLSRRATTKFCEKSDSNSY